MSYVLAPSCNDLRAAGFDEQRAAEEVWEAMLSAGVFVAGEFVFASGVEATLKADAENLYKHPRQLEVVLGQYATFPCIKEADVLLYVPDGSRQFMNMLGEGLGVPVAQAIRTPGSKSRYDFMFETKADEALALAAERPRIGEDVVTTLGSVAGMRSLLKPDQDVHSLAMLLRGDINTAYQVGLVDHYLVRRRIPLDAGEFRQSF